MLNVVHQLFVPPAHSSLPSLELKQETTRQTNPFSHLNFCSVLLATKKTCSLKIVKELYGVYMIENLGSYEENILMFFNLLQRQTFATCYISDKKRPFPPF